MPSELSQTKWTCTVCNREMELLSRRSHLQGKPHLAKVAASESTATNELGNGNDNENGTSAGAPPGVWTCTTCNCQMPISCRETHVQGQPHRKKASARPSASTNGNNDSLRSRLEYWTCTICDCHLPLGSRETHLKGKPHLKKAARARARTGASMSSVPDPPSANSTSERPLARLGAGPFVVSEPVSAPPPPRSSENWTCVPCGRQMNVRNREQHLQGKPHKDAVGRNRSGAGFWRCNVCSVTMNVSYRERHLEGEMHAGALIQGLDAVGEEGGSGGGGGGPGGGGGGGGGPGDGRGGGRRGRRVNPYNGLTLSEEEAIMARLKWLGRGRIPGGGGCSSGDDFPGDYDYDSEPDWSHYPSIESMAYKRGY